MRRSMFFLTLLLVGCVQQQPAADPPIQPVAAVQPVAITPVQPTQPIAPQPAPPPPEFAFADDLTGDALPRVVAPPAPPAPPVERLGTAPKSRSVPAKVLDPNTLAPVSYAPPPVMPPHLPVVKLTAPPEVLPLDLGAGADDVPAKPVLPVATVVKERARDVNLPPALPTLGRPVTDRVSLDDPTSDAGNAVIVAGSAKSPLSASSFLEVTVPDPFEHGWQLKPKVPPTAEPSAVPVPVNPQRVK